MFALCPRDMSSLLRYTIIALLIVIGAVMLSVCADGSSGACGHTCCTGADRGRRLRRLARKLRSTFRSALDLALLLCGAARDMATSTASWAPTQALLKVSALRI